VWLNKCDLVADPLSLEPLRTHDPQALTISARTGDGIPALARWVQERADFAKDAVWIAIPIARSRLQADVRRAATVLDQRFEEERALFRVRARKSVLEELTAKGGVVLSDEEAPDARRP
jgi:GTP-binding protein HflX